VKPIAFIGYPLTAVAGRAAMNQKLITVFGDTGAQGGGLARAILDDRDGGFAVRAVTRHVDSDKVRALSAAGAEVVAA
jgi:NmrA-like family